MNCSCFVYLNPRGGLEYRKLFSFGTSRGRRFCFLLFGVSLFHELRKRNYGVKDIAFYKSWLYDRRGLSYMRD